MGKGDTPSVVPTEESIQTAVNEIDIQDIMRILDTNLYSHEKDVRWLLQLLIDNDDNEGVYTAEDQNEWERVFTYLRDLRSDTFIKKLFDDFGEKFKSVPVYDELLRIVQHDLANALTVVTGYSELILIDKKIDSKRSEIQDIIDHWEQVRLLVEDVVARMIEFQRTPEILLREPHRLSLDIDVFEKYIDKLKEKFQL